MSLSTAGLSHPSPEERSAGEKKCLNSELWHACAGPLVCLPAIGSRVVYFPQGHSEQVAASTNKEVTDHVPNYPSLPPQLICQLHDVTMHADVETDEVYAQMTLQPLSPQEQKDAFLPAELGIPNKQPTNYFCKTLTASDTSTHGGFSVPRRAAEKVFPPLDFSQQPPAQELIARDLHDVEWKFRHIFRGQPKRHLLTTGWSVFVSAKRLVAGDSVIFIWNEKNQLLLGIRRAARPQTVMPSSVLSSDSMHIGLLAAAAHAAATNSRFTVFYNPRASPSEFVISLAKYIKAVFHTRVSVGMRFRMLFETEESSVRRYMGTITGISDLDPVRWSNSHWRSVKVGWDESTAGVRQPRVSLWEIEPLTTFPMYPSLFPLRLKRPWLPEMSPLHTTYHKEDDGNAFLWARGDAVDQAFQSYRSMGFSSWPQQRIDLSTLGAEQDQFQSVASTSWPNDDSTKQSLLNFQNPLLSLQFPNRFGLVSPRQMIPHTQPSQNPLNLLSTHGMIDDHTRNQLVQQQLLQPFLDHQQPLQNNNMSSFQVASNGPSPPPPPQLPFAISPAQRPLFGDSTCAFSSALTPTMQAFFSPLPSEENAHLLNNLHGNRTEAAEPQEQAWVEKGPFPQVESFRHSLSLPPFHGRDGEVDEENCTADSQNQNVLFGVNINNLQSLVLPSAVSSLTGAVDGQPDAAAMQFTASGFHNLLPSAAYDSLEDSPGLLQHPGQLDPHCQTFVKVYKSGCVGRSLDISRFSSYHELRNELSQMFGLEGLLEDPQRSGWQLVFVDRENDVLLMGDDPWEAFVNSVWSIKILSPQDVQCMGGAQKNCRESYDEYHPNKPLGM